MTATAQDAPPDAAPARPLSRRPRLFEPMPAESHWRWTGPLLVTAIAAVLRLADLGWPRKFMVDETYYAKDAWAMLRTGAGRQWPDGVDGKILAGTPVPVPTEPSFVVHPEIGKWVIAAGEQAFGLTPFGWRIGVAILGTLTVLLTARIGRRLFRSTLLGCVAALIVALDGLSIVLSRVAFLDGTLTFLVLAAFGCLLVDRDRARAAYDAWADRVGPLAASGWGPRLWWRQWRLAAVVLLGLAAGTKWSGAYALVVFGLLTVLWDAAARRTIGVRSARVKALVVDAPVAALTVAGTAVVAYLFSWIGWISSPDGSNRTWAADNPAEGLAALVPDWLRSLWHYHAEMLRFHADLSSPHDYASDPWGWLLLTRPFLIEYAGVDSGAPGCPDGPCSSAVLAVGSPAVWWPGVAALVVVTWVWLARRDWRAGAVLAGVAGTYLPWFLLLDRTIFSWYVVATAPFVALGLALVAGMVLGPPDTAPRRRTVGAAVVGGYLLVVVAAAAWFWPIWTGEVITYTSWQQRMWLPDWV